MFNVYGRDSIVEAGQWRMFQFHTNVSMHMQIDPGDSSESDLTQGDVDRRMDGLQQHRGQVDFGALWRQRSRRNALTENESTYLQEGHLPPTKPNSGYVYIMQYNHTGSGFAQQTTRSSRGLSIPEDKARAELHPSAFCSTRSGCTRGGR